MIDKKSDTRIFLKSLFPRVFTVFVLISLAAVKVDSRKPTTRIFGQKFVYSRIPAPTREDPKATKEVIELIGRARVFRGKRALFANRIKIIGRDMEKAFAFGRVRAFDKEGNTEITGGYAEYHSFGKGSRRKSFTRVTQKPVLIYTKKPAVRKRKKGDNESYRVIVHGKEFTRFEDPNFVEIKGPVTFTKSDEYLHGKSQKAIYKEKAEFLHLIGDCLINRGDDIYRAGKIRYYTGRRFLDLSIDAHLTVYDYRLDPFEESYKDPFVTGKPNGQKEEDKDSPFAKRPYRLLEKLRPIDAKSRYQIRQFINSRADIFGNQIIYNSENRENTIISVSGEALFRRRSGFFMADFLRVNQSPAATVVGYGDLYGERFSDSSMIFGDIFQYYEDEKWGRFHKKAHMIQIQKESNRNGRRINSGIHFRGDEIERFFDTKKSYIKGNVRINQEEMSFTGTYGEMDEETSLFRLLGAPIIKKGQSMLLSNIIILNLGEKKGVLDASVKGAFFQNEKSADGQFEEYLKFKNSKKIIRILKVSRDIRLYKGREIMDK